jgi:hypothetical protein
MIHDNTGKGVLFKNYKKTDAKHADYNGSLNVDGEEFWLNGWLRESRNGVEYLSLSIKKKTAAAGKTDGELDANNRERNRGKSGSELNHFPKVTDPTLDLQPAAPTAVPFDDEVPF